MIKNWTKYNTNPFRILLANQLWNAFVENYFIGKDSLILSIMDNYEINKLRNLFLERPAIVPVDALLTFKIRDLYFSDVSIHGFRLNLFFEVPNALGQLNFQYDKSNQESRNSYIKQLNPETGNFEEFSLLYPEDISVVQKMLEQFAEEIANHINESIYCEVVRSKEIARDFPELDNVKILGIPISNGYYIRLSNDELLEDGFLVNSRIDRLVGKPCFFDAIARNHQAIRIEGDYYFMNKWDAEQVAIELKNKLKPYGVYAYL